MSRPQSIKEDSSTQVVSEPVPVNKVFEPERFDSISVTRRILILVSLGLCSFLYAIEQTIVATSVDTIASKLAITGSITWITNSYLLTTTAFQPIVGRITDVIGKKALLLGELWIFIIGNIIAGSGNSLIQLVAGRLISGVGGAGLLSISCIIISDMTHERQRGSYLNFINVVFVVADAIGPLIGASFSEKASWRWLFFFNIPFGPFITLILFFVLHTSPPTCKITSFKQAATKIDLWGMFTLVSSLTLLVVALNLGGHSFAWNSSTVIGLLVGAFVSFVIFIVVERRVAVNPVIPVHLFTRWERRNVPIMVIARTLLFFHLFATTFYVPIFLGAVKQLSPIVCGALITPFLIMAAIASTITNHVASKFGHIRPLFMASLVILPVGMGLMSTLDSSASIGKVVGYSLICGIGFGSGTQISLVIAQNGVELEYLPTVTAFVSSAPNLGGVLGVTIIGVIITGRVKSELQKLVPELASSLNYNDPLSLTGSGVSQDDVATAFSKGFRDGFLTLAGVAAFQFVICLFLRRIVLDDGSKLREVEESEKVTENKPKEQVV